MDAIHLRVASTGALKQFLPAMEMGQCLVLHRSSVFHFEHFSILDITILFRKPRFIELLQLQLPPYAYHYPLPRFILQPINNRKTTLGDKLVLYGDLFGDYVSLRIDDT